MAPQNFKRSTSLGGKGNDASTQIGPSNHQPKEANKNSNAIESREWSTALTRTEWDEIMEIAFMKGVDPMAMLASIEAKQSSSTADATTKNHSNSVEESALSPDATLPNNVEAHRKAFEWLIKWKKQMETKLNMESAQTDEVKSDYLPTKSLDTTKIQSIPDDSTQGRETESTENKAGELQRQMREREAALWKKKQQELAKREKIKVEKNDDKHKSAATVTPNLGPQHWQKVTKGQSEDQYRRMLEDQRRDMIMTTKVAPMEEAVPVAMKGPAQGPGSSRAQRQVFLERETNNHVKFTFGRNKITYICMHICMFICMYEYILYESELM